MPARRSATIQDPSCSPRASLDASVYPTVDSVIKTLKICTRRLQAALSSHHVELQVLEKLHYKGNNQHRTALFWRRVVDIRRGGRRVQEVAVHELVTKLRLSFWGNVTQNPKLLKGSWTHVPDSNTVHAILRRLNECRTLVSHSQDRLIMAYNQFNLDLQTGAFLQLILVLTAVASRLHILLEELGSAIDECKHTCVQLLGVLDPTHVPSNVSSVAQTPTEVLAGMSILPSPLIGDDEEDVGQSTPAVRRSEILSETQVDQLQVAASRGDKEPEVESLDFMFSTNTNSSASMPIAHSTVVHTTITAHEEQDNPTTKRRREERSTRVTKKKRKKDEIDNIFGF